MENKILKIIDLDENGRGIAKSDGIIYFVENAILGETLKADIMKIKKRFIEAKKINTIEKSPYLIESDINEKDLCGIYELYNIDYEKQIEFKKNMIINQLRRIANIEIADIDFVKAENRLFYRNKVELKLSYNGELSYFSRFTNENIPIRNCVMNTKAINEVVKKLKSILDKHKIKGYDSNTDEGVIKNIIIRSTSLNETMLIIVFNQDIDFSAFYKDIEKNNIVDSFYMSRNTIKRDYKIKDLVYISGKKKITEKLGDFVFNISPKAFMQINKEISYKIYLKAKEFVAKLNPKYIIDMYSGISTTSILLSENAEKIFSIEINEDAVNDAKENAKINNISNIEWINKPAEKAIDDLNMNLENSLALFDPPRKGLDEKIITKIGNSKIDNIIYISCNPATLARDVKRFAAFGFKLREIIGYDQFVNTVHSEAITLLSRSVSDADNSK